MARRPGIDAEAAKAWFLESANRMGLARQPARRTVPRAASKTGAVEAELSRLFRERLKWADGSDFYRRTRESAPLAIDGRDCVRAIILCYEAIKIEPGMLASGARDPMSRRIRMEAENFLFEPPAGGNRESPRDMNDVRDASAHKTRSDRAGVQRIINDIWKFGELVPKPFRWFDRLSAAVNGCGPIMKAAGRPGNRQIVGGRAGSC